MPTVYTYKVPEGQSFEDFILGCAKAFGACISLRDDPNDAPIPDKFETSTYHAEQIETAVNRIRELERFTDEECEAEAEKEFSAAMDYYRERVEKNTKTETNYRAMIAKVQDWKSPSTEHDELKAFMLQQLGESVKFDVHEPTLPTKKTGRQWYNAQRETAEYSLNYHTTEQQKETERVNGRNQWVRQLRDSIK